jgi:hypothetical protein
MLISSNCNLSVLPRLCDTPRVVSSELSAAKSVRDVEHSALLGGKAAQRLLSSITSAAD